MNSKVIQKTKENKKTVNNYYSLFDTTDLKIKEPGFECSTDHDIIKLAERQSRNLAKQSRSSVTNCLNLAAELDHEMYEAFYGDLPTDDYTDIVEWMGTIFSAVNEIYDNDPIIDTEVFLGTLRIWAVNDNYYFSCNAVASGNPMRTCYLETLVDD